MHTDSLLRYGQGTPLRVPVPVQWVQPSALCCHLRSAVVYSSAIFISVVCRSADTVVSRLLCGSFVHFAMQEHLSSFSSLPGSVSK